MPGSNSNSTYFHKTQVKQAKYLLKHSAPEIAFPSVMLSLDPRQQRIAIGLLFLVGAASVTQVSAKTSRQRSFFTSVVDADGSLRYVDSDEPPAASSHYPLAESSSLKEKYSNAEINIAKNNFAMTLDRLADQNKNLSCKLQELKDFPSFKFNFVDKEMLGTEYENGQINVSIDFATRSNVALDANNLQHLIQSVQLAFWSLQNLQQKRIYPDPDTGPLTKGVPCHLPDSQRKTGEMDCKEINSLLHVGLEKIRILGSILQQKPFTPPTSLYYDEFIEIKIESPQSDKYRELIREYEPLKIKAETALDIKALQKSGYIDAKLNVLKPFTSYSAPDHSVTKLVKKHGTTYDLTLSATSKDFAPFADFKLFIGHLEKPIEQRGEKVELYIAQLISIIHTVFGKYPELMDYFFEGLSEYEQKMAGPSYSACLKR